MQLPLDAGEQRARSFAAVPAARERDEPGANEVAREVLLRDGDLAALPPLAQVAQVREQRLFEDDVDGERGEEPIERDLRSGLVERLERRAERRLRVAQQGRVRARRCRPRRTSRAASAAASPRSRLARIARTRATSASP